MGGWRFRVLGTGIWMICVMRSAGKEVDVRWLEASALCEQSD